MEKNKYTLYSIIILLIVFVPCTIYGVYMHIKTTANLNHDFKFNNKLYFYENDKLLGTYECKSEDCDYATTSNSNLKTNILNNKYAFIKDAKEINFIDITTGETITKYEEIQELANNIFGVKSNDKWGVISISVTLMPVLQIDFDSIEFKNNKFVVSKDNFWSIYQGQNELFKNELPIKDFNEEFVIVSDDSTDKIYDFKNNEYITIMSNKELTFIENLVLLKIDNNYYVYQMNNIADDYVPAIIGNFFYNGEEKIIHELSETSINFYAGEELLKTIELSVQEND